MIDVSIDYLKLELASGKEPTWVNLQTPMILQPPFSVQIASTTKFLVVIDKETELVEIPAPATLAVVTSNKLTVQIMPCTPLTSKFVEGWNKLPFELKYEVVAQNMRLYPLRVPDPVPLGISTRPDDQNPALGRLLEHCRMTPEFAHLAKLAFYKENEWQIWLVPKCFHVPLRYPPRQLNCYVHRLIIRLFMSSEHWRLLRRLAEGSLGFENLKFIDILVNWSFILVDHDLHAPLQSQAWQHFFSERSGTPIEFKCKGRIDFDPRRFDKLLHDDEAESVDVSAVKQFLIREKVKFRGNVLETDT
ncbi:hypothetical protein N0V90_000142 [Kalmusia sp. IMI 367209]|nr:hypothetical protein N0V90_000142 [Kalmusia sp. IMI 367209]